MSKSPSTDNALPDEQELELEIEKADLSFEKRYNEALIEIEKLQKQLVKQEVKINSLLAKVSAFEKEIKNIPEPINIVLTEQESKV